MANAYKNGVTVQRTTASEWTVYQYGVAEKAHTSRRAAQVHATGLAGGLAGQQEQFGSGTPVGEVQVVTLTSYTGTDSFQLATASGATASFVRGTNGTAAAIQAALRTLTGDASLTVSGTTDEGPFTVTWVANLYPQPLLRQGFVSGCTAAITRSTQGGIA